MTHPDDYTYEDDEPDPRLEARPLNGLSPDAADALRNEMAFREATGRTAVPDTDWDWD